MRRFASILSIPVVLVAASVAEASDHGWKISEVLRSHDGDTGVAFVELTDEIGAEPNPADPYSVTVYDADGIELDAVSFELGAVSSWFVSSAAADAEFGTTGDAALDFALPDDGQVCIEANGGRKIHCLAWGCVNTLVTAGASRGASPPDGQSLSRQGNGTYHVANPTPDAANAAGTAEPACPTAPDADPSVPDADPTSPDARPGTGGGGGDDGGCCQTGERGAAGSLALALIAVVALRRRRATGP
jgi:uncharacterized protein (TIGR03382 family)